MALQDQVFRVGDTTCRYEFPHRISGGQDVGFQRVGLDRHIKAAIAESDEAVDQPVQDAGPFGFQLGFNFILIAPLVLGKLVKADFERDEQQAPPGSPQSLTWHTVQSCRAGIRRSMRSEATRST